jgi:hypothetical protein
VRGGLVDVARSRLGCTLDLTRTSDDWSVDASAAISDIAAQGEDDGMNYAAKAQAEAIFKRREAERTEFEAQLKAQRDKAQRLRALRLTREEARWAEHWPKVIEDIKEGLVMLHEETAEMRTEYPETS